MTKRIGNFVLANLLICDMIIPVKNGTVDISQLDNLPEPHEFDTAKYLAALGKDIVFICPSEIKGAHTPDIRMDGVEWEIKSPTGGSKRTIENNFRHAVVQSRYIIFDLRRIKIPMKQCIAQLDREFHARSYLKRLLVIKSDGSMIEIS